MMNKRDILLNAFRPGAAIELPSQFAGRAPEITRIVDTLYMDGICPIIYGDRGLGKSSLAFQIARIGVGDTELLEEIGIGDRALPDGSRFTPFMFSCSDSTNTKDQLLQRLINTAEGYAGPASLPQRVLESTTTTSTTNLRIYQRKVQETYKSASRKGFEDLSIEEKLTAITQEILADHAKVLYIIDEIDRVRDTAGLASVIKNMSSKEVKFLIVGVANNVSTLLHDHGSIQRSLVEVRLSSMADDESAAIVKKAENFLRSHQLNISFDADATSLLVASAAGFPWFVHTLGLEALVIATEGNKSVVSKSDVTAAIARLATRRFAQQFYDAYQMAVGDSHQRESVLRLFAKWLGTDVPTSEIYPLANKLKVTNPSVSTKQLTLQKFGRVLVRPPYAPSGVFRFTNAMFRQYVNLRASVYSGVQDQVDKVWNDRFQS